MSKEQDAIDYEYLRVHTQKEGCAIEAYGYRHGWLRGWLAGMATFAGIVATYAWIGG